MLWVLGGFTVYERGHATPGREAVVAGSGPVTTMALALGFWGAAQAVGGTDLRALVLLEALAWGNGLMAVYNLLPGLPLDGGAILKSAVWAVTGSQSRGTLVAAWSGRVVAVLLLTVPLVVASVAGGTPPWGLILTFAIFSALLWTGATERAEARPPRAAPARPVRGGHRTTCHPGGQGPPSGGGAAAAGGVRCGRHGRGRPPGAPDRGSPRGGGGGDAPAASAVGAGVVRGPHRGPGCVVPFDLAGEGLLAVLQEHPAAEYLVVDGEGHMVGVLATADVERALSG